MAFVYTYGLTSSDFGDGTVGSAYQPHNYCYGGPVTFSEAGDVDQLGARVAGISGTPTVKTALYDTSGNLVVDGGSFTAVNNTQTWSDAPAFTATSVSATTYYIFISSSDTFLSQSYDSGNDGTGDLHGYSTFPESSNSFTAGNETGTGFGRRANFTAGGGGSTFRGLTLLGVGA